MEIKKQTKFGVAISEGEHQGLYGPFDTREAAGKTQKALAARGLVVTDPFVVWTVSSARSLVAVLPVQEQSPEVPETPEVAATPKQAEVTRRRRAAAKK